MDRFLPIKELKHRPVQRRRCLFSPIFVENCRGTIVCSKVNLHPSAGNLYISAKSQPLLHNRNPLRRHLQLFIRRQEPEFMPDNGHGRPCWTADGMLRSLRNGQYPEPVSMIHPPGSSKMLLVQSLRRISISAEPLAVHMVA